MAPRKFSLTAAAVLLTIGSTGFAADLTFTDPVRVEERATGRVVSTTRATNEGSTRRSIEVTVKGARFVAGHLAPGEAATLTVIEGPGQPVILFNKH